MKALHAKWAALALTLAVVAAACGGGNRSGTGSTTAPSSGGGATSSTAPSNATFGDAPMPCGPAPAGATNAASDTGVTASTITIGAGDDRGYAPTPGLSKEMTEAIQAIVARCNSLGGINGRTVKVNVYDAAVLQVQQAMTKACADKNFFLVGEGWALDSNQEEIRLGCKLPAVPGYSVSSAFANAPLMYQATPNPADRALALPAEQLQKLQPDAVTAAATLAANFSATTETRDKVLAAFPKFGWKFLPNSNFEYPITGQADWTPTIKQIKASGAKLVYWVGSCGDLQKAMQAAKLNNFKAVWATDANHYLATCAGGNTDGAMDGLYIRMAYTPIEEANTSKAVQDYVAMIKAAGKKPALLGMQATSSFLLWATAVQECGAQLTRDCVLQKLSQIHDWTGHGLHAKADPGANLPPSCGMLIQIEGTKYVRTTPTTPGTFDCDPNSVVPVVTEASKAAKLDANRVAQEFNH
jgi:ABC-type branched-subunit amino acid transport system substrate-binding protein